MNSPEQSATDATDALQVERGRPVSYVALCPECGGVAGVTSNREEHRDSAAGFVAGFILDGLAVVSCATKAEYLAYAERWCDCGDGKNEPFHQDGPPDHCPECQTPVWETKKRNTCRDCGTRWTAEKGLTMYRVQVFRKRAAKAEQSELLAAAPTPTEPR